MLRFNTPNARLKFNRSNADTLLRSEKLFDTFPLHSVSFTFSSSVHKERFEDILSTDENVYFIAKDVTAKSFIEKQFLEQFVKSGSLLAFCHNARVEVENFLAIVPPGNLVLSLEKSIAQSLALQKEKQKKKNKRINAFETIVIDIICSAFSPGRKLYDFVSFELSKIEHIKFTLLLKWKPNGNVCPQSIKAYFESQNIQCIACKPNQKYSSNFSVPMPLLNNDVPNINVHDVLEWIGMQICGIEYSDTENEYVSKCFIAEPSEILKRLYKCSFEGFYSKVEVLPIIKEIRNMFEIDSTLPFVIVCLSGFQHSYIITNDYQYFSSCDKLICIIAFPSSDYWIITLNTQ